MSISEAFRIQRHDVLSPKDGYDIAAPWYDKWHWTQFWKYNELPMVGNLLNKLTPGRILDAGTGTGAYRFQLEDRGHEIVGLDISTKMLEIQAKKERFVSHTTSVKLLNGDIQHMPFGWSETFDCIICARVLSHIEDALTTIREFSRVLKKEGRLILTDVDPAHPYEHVKISNGSIHSIIRAFKHDHSELTAFFASAHLRIELFRRFALQDLYWLPPKDRFAKIYCAPKRPIFFICELIKQQ